MAMDFVGGIQRLEAMGLSDVLLPFMLIFAVVYAILIKAKILGDKKNIHIVVALVISLLVVIPHVTGGYPPGKDVVEMINSAVPNVSLIIIAIVMLLIMIGVFGANINIVGTPLAGIVVVVSLLMILAIFGGSAGWWGGVGLPSWLGFLNDPDTQALLVVVLMFGVIIWVVTGEEGGGPKMGEGIQKFFEGIGQAVRKS